MQKFTMGAIAGASSLVVAIPLLAQVAGAATGVTSSAADAAKKQDRPIPTQECVQAMASQEGTMLGNLDTHIAAHKAALTAHHAAMVAAASITDETARKEALQDANEAMRTAMEAAKPDAATMQAAQDALQSACGDGFHMGMGGPMMGGDKPSMGMKGGEGRGPRMENLAEQFGMTEDELKAALDAGQTIQQIATEKGVELPEPPLRGGRFFGRGAQQDAESATSSAQQ